MASMKKAINPSDLAAPVGFAHGWLVVNGEGRTLYLAGQCGYDREGRVAAPGDLVAQLDLAMANVGSVLREAEMGYEDLVQLNLYVTNRDDYAAARSEFGKVWRKHCKRHYPAMAMFQVVSLYDPEAAIEIQGVAAR